MVALFIVRDAALRATRAILLRVLPMRRRGRFVAAAAASRRRRQALMQRHRRHIVHVAVALAVGVTAAAAGGCCQIRRRQGGQCATVLQIVVAGSIANLRRSSVRTNFWTRTRFLVVFVHSICVCMIHHKCGVQQKCIMNRPLTDELVIGGVSPSHPNTIHPSPFIIVVHAIDMYVIRTTAKSETITWLCIGLVRERLQQTGPFLLISLLCYVTCEKRKENNENESEHHDTISNPVTNETPPPSNQ